MNEHIEIQKIQQESAVKVMHDLVMMCRFRFLAAAALLEIEGPTVNAVNACGASTSPNVWPLLPAYDLISQRYIDEIYSPERDLFDRMPAEALGAKWSSFLYHYLLKHAVNDNRVVRDTLRAVGALPCRDMRAATEAISQYFREVSLYRGVAILTKEETARFVFEMPARGWDETW